MVDAAQRRDFQVLIVGTGPAGLTMANLLGSAGIRTLVIEKDEQLSLIPKALLVDDEFFRLLATAGLGDAIKAHGVFPISFDYYSPIGFRIGHVEARITEHNYSLRTATFQPEFEKILCDGAKRFPNVSIAFGEELIDLAQNASGVTASVKKGEEIVRYDVAYIVAADGSHSTCRKLLDIPFDEVVKFGDRHIVVDVLEDPDDSKVALTKLGWRRNFVSLPSPNGGRRYECSLDDDETDEAVLEDTALATLLRPICDLGRLRVIRKAVYAFHSRLARRLQAGRVFLVGDSAHIMPIFGSQGMNSGARDVKNLAWKLVSVLQGKAAPALLDTYHEERYDHLVDTIRIATANGKLQSVRLLPLTLSRDLLLGALSIVPAIQNWVRDMRYIPKPYLTSGFLIKPRARSSGLVGRVIPNPTLRVAGKTTLLDDFIGAGFALVGVEPDGAPPAALNHPLWRTLEATRIVLHRPGTDVRQLDGITSAEIADERFVSALRHHAGQWLVVRPDRIVAAAADPERLAESADRLAILLRDGDAPAQQSKAA